MCVRIFLVGALLAPSLRTSIEEESLKQKITGIGGVFFRSKNPAKLAAWYKQHLGLPIEDGWPGCQFHWREMKNPKKQGATVWSAFKADTDYFGKGKPLHNAPQGHMINYRVDNLKKMLAQMKKEGVWIDPKSKLQATEYGKFAWIKDGEGNRIELWEPPPPQRPATPAAPKRKQRRSRKG